MNVWKGLQNPSSSECFKCKLFIDLNKYVDSIKVIVLHLLPTNILTNINNSLMTTLTFRVPDELSQLLEELCKEEDRSKSWFMKKALQEKLEEWRDVRIALKGRAEYEKNPNIAVSHGELMRELGLK